MSKPLHHAKRTLANYGGSLADHCLLHTTMDTSKSAYPKMAHRAVFHHDFGHKVVGAFLKNRLPNMTEADIAGVLDQHTTEDLGFVPTLEYWDKYFDPKSDLVKQTEHLTVEDHCELSAKKFGGDPKDYESYHKALYKRESPCVGAMFHSAFGCFVFEQAMGRDDGIPIAPISGTDNWVAVRDIAEQHIMRLYGRIPELSDWLSGIDRPWMAGSRKFKFVIVD